MRTCAFDAELINENAQQIYNLLQNLRPLWYIAWIILKDRILHNQEISNFTIVDCGDTVDLTTHKLLNDEQLGEITERAGDFCGSIFIDAGFMIIYEEYLEMNLQYRFT
ncbi:hypothetical protein C1645_595608 [Glomus cerebriforme]|uniref:Uncharacterized protein n=1 Tax=Glomus cerebriforme TaxID=658196 RepID=A0A397S8H1_9GLOM|nr:hypothetical protein C1645_595608 [Glomus cerebriforme]